MALQWLMQSKYNAGAFSHILDDYFFIGPADSQSCKNDLCKTIGVPIKMSKIQTPTTSIIFYGIEIDSCKMEARLPVEKIDKVRKYILVM